MVPPPQGIEQSDFETIEAAVMETERGRWFLAEFARRLRAEDTARILAAVDRLETRKAQDEAAAAVARAEAARVAALTRELGELIRDLRPLADARARSAALARIANATQRPSLDSAGALEARLAALVDLDALDIEAELKLLG